MTIEDTFDDLKRDDLDDLIERARKAIVSLDEMNARYFEGVDERLSQKAHGVRDGLKALIELRDCGDLNFDSTNNPLVPMAIESTGGRYEGLDLLLGYMRSYARF